MKHLPIKQIIGAGLMAASLMTSLPALAQDKLSVMLDWFVNPDHAPIVVAKEGGFSPIFYTVSFAGAEELARKLSEGAGAEPGGRRGMRNTSMAAR